jgi:hypothetical protein
MVVSLSKSCDASTAGAVPTVSAIARLLRSSVVKIHASGLHPSIDFLTRFISQRLGEDTALSLEEAGRQAIAGFHALGYLLFEHGDRSSESLDSILTVLDAAMPVSCVPDSALAHCPLHPPASITGGPPFLQALASSLSAIVVWLEVRHCAQVCAGNLLQRGGGRLKAHHPALYRSLWKSLRLVSRLPQQVHSSVLQILVDVPLSEAEGCREAIRGSPACGVDMQGRLMSSLLRAAQSVLPSCAALYRPNLDELLRLLHNAMVFESAFAPSRDRPSVAQPSSPGTEEPSPTPSPGGEDTAPAPTEAASDSTAAAASAAATSRTSKWRSHERLPCNPPTPERRRGPGYATVIDVPEKLSMDASSPLTPSVGDGADASNGANSVFDASVARSGPHMEGSGFRAATEEVRMASGPSASAPAGTGFPRRRWASSAKREEPSEERALPQQWTVDSAKESGSGSDWIASSDVEGGGSRSGSARQVEARVRIGALACISAVARASPGLLHARLGLFIPQVQAVHPRPYAPSLVTVMLFDTSDKVREAAADALAAVLDGAPLSKWIALPPITDDATLPADPPLSEAAKKRIAKARAARMSAARTPGSVTTASDRTIAMVREVHKGLVKSLAQAVVAKSSHSGLTTAILKTVSVLIGVTPYDRLDSGLVSSLAAKLCPLLQARHQAIVVSTLQCIGILVTAKGCLSEVNVALYDSPSGNRTGLLRLLLDIAQDTHAPAVVRSEVLATLAKASRHYVRALSLAWDRIAPILADSFKDSQPSVRSSGLRVLEELLRARAAEAAALGGAGTGTVQATARTTGRVAADEDGADTRGIPGTGQVETLVPLRDGTEASLSVGWPSVPDEPASDKDALPLVLLMSDHLPRALKDPAVPVRAAACMCISYLLPADWQALLASSDRDALELPMPVVGQPTAATAAVSAPSRGRTLLREVLDGVHLACIDDSATVRAAGCRVLGAYSAFELWKHPWFARQAAVDLLKCAQDEVLNVRAKAAWALGSLCAAPVLVAALPPTLHAAELAKAASVRSLGSDALASSALQPELSRTSPLRPVVDDHPPGSHHTKAGTALAKLLGERMLRTITSLLITLCADHDRVASSAARTLGLTVAGVIGSTTRSTDLSADDSALVERSIRELSKLVSSSAAISPKTRWNACYALGLALSVELSGFVPTSSSPSKLPSMTVERDMEWADQATRALESALCGASNFKVRIAAAQALADAGPCNPVQAARASCALIRGLVSIDATEDFTDYRYKSQLEGQAADALVDCLRVAGASPAVVECLHDHWAQLHPPEGTEESSPRVKMWGQVARLGVAPPSVPPVGAVPSE